MRFGGPLDHANDFRIYQSWIEFEFIWTSEIRPVVFLEFTGKVDMKRRAARYVLLYLLVTDNFILTKRLDKPRVLGLLVLLI